MITFSRRDEYIRRNNGGENQWGMSAENIIIIPLL